MLSAYPNLMRPLLRSTTIALTVCLTTLLAACNPTFNWREVSLQDDHAKILMPGKPDGLERSIVLDTFPVKMTMQGVKINETTFTVANAVLPDQTTATADRAVAAMRSQMVKNIAGKESKVTPIKVRVVDDAGKDIRTLDAQRIVVMGSAQTNSLQMTASFVAYKGTTWQWLVISQASNKDTKFSEATEEFLSSFRLIEKK